MIPHRDEVSAGSGRSYVQYMHVEYEYEVKLGPSPRCAYVQYDVLKRSAGECALSGLEPPAQGTFVKKAATEIVKALDARQI